jgi:hypothetical protein
LREEVDLERRESASYQKTDEGTKVPKRRTAGRRLGDLARYLSRRTAKYEVVITDASEEVAMAAFGRIGGLCGLTFVVVFGIIQFTSGEPSRTASQQEITRYLAGHQTSNEVVGAVALLLSGVVALFAVSAWSWLRSGHDDLSPAWPMTGLIGGVAMAVNLAFLGATFAAEGWMGDKLAAQPVLAQTVFTSEQTLGTAIFPFIALLLLGMGMATLETKALPVWSAWLAFAGAALSVALTLQLVFPGSALDVVGAVHALVALGWFAIVSIYMLLPQRVATVARARTA